VRAGRPGRRVKDAELAGDGLTHDILVMLNSTFVTPFDREDIHRLTAALDDVVDAVEEAAARIVIYRLGVLPPGVCAQVEVLCRAATATASAMPKLADVTSLAGYTEDINALEDEADALHHDLLAELLAPAGPPEDLLPGARAQRGRRHARRRGGRLREGCQHRGEHRGQGVLTVLLAGIVLVVVVALAFDWTNGFHDAANAIATSVATRALTPPVALGMAAAMNLVGAFLGTEVASTVGGGVIEAPRGTSGLAVVLAALVGAIVWNLITWRLGLPSSSSHGLIGGLVGAALAAGSGVQWSGVVNKVIVPMVVSPVLGFALAAVVMLAILWIFRRGRPRRLTAGFRHAQAVSAAAMALGHGLQDAQKTMGVIVLALVVGGFHEGFAVPWWVVLLSAGALSAGTAVGGKRIMRTLGRRIIDLDPPRGFAAEVSASALLFVTAFGFAAPISTTQTITASIPGVGTTRRLSAVRWTVAGDVAVAWVLTIPAAASWRQAPTP